MPRTRRLLARSRSVLALMGLVAAIPASAQTPRPQDPPAEVPYSSEPFEVVVPVGEDGDGGHTLAGTVTLPDPARFGDGPHPGVVLISGSGPQNRDSEFFGHRPFLVLADRLTRAGIAVLRYDDRGVGASTGVFAEGTIPRFAHDAAAAAAALRAHPGVDSGRVGLIGHSEGGTVAPLVAAEHPETAFIVLLAGMGVGGKEILLYQSALMYERGGQPREWIEENRRVRSELFDAVAAGLAEDELRPLVRALVDQEMTHIQNEDGRERMVGMLIGQFANPWIRGFVSIDPAEALRRVRVPVLALNGTLDTQVPADMNLDGIERALAEGPCPSATIVRLPGLNHLFQPAETGMLGEYGAIETTFDEATMGLIAGWIKAVAGRSPNKSPE
ncbi:MAG: alpha/beta hydrolase [Phycisphaerales bacterium]|nr:alpha/beta hydrolase [Planctomycetota bacterium]MCH8509736.1 alpha/beta hydrolase [Phycisphaerales bacterium]